MAATKHDPGISSPSTMITVETLTASRLRVGGLLLRGGLTL